jgi:hypothetical protein
MPQPSNPNPSSNPLSNPLSKKFLPEQIRRPKLQRIPIQAIRKATGPDRSALINTPLQRGGYRSGWIRNRFNGFDGVGETVETVAEFPAPRCTPLKRGVNESGAAKIIGCVNRTS